MMIGDIFERPIDRDIDTVIVAGQNREEKIFQELDEYVVTDELLGHFKKFFEMRRMKRFYINIVLYFI